ncbi:MAG: type VI secretion system Vgr family protein [Bacteroidales bacterium]
MSILIDNLEIKINNTKYEEYCIINVALLKDLHRPNELKFSMRKKSLLKTAEDISFSLANNLLGASIKLEIKTLRRDENEEIKHESLTFNGIIFNVNSSRETIGSGILINITAFSPDYLLYDNQHCYSYEDKTLDEIVKESISDYSQEIKLDVNPKMNSVIPYVVQYNENTYQFLSRLAHRYGEFFYYEDGKMVFGKIIPKETVELYPDIDILGYHYDLKMDHSNFSHCLHNYLSYENTSEKSTHYTNKSLNSLTDYVYNKSLSTYKKETFHHLHSGIQEEDSTIQLDKSIKAKGMGGKSQMMICHAVTNRVDLQIGSKISIIEFFDKDDGSVEQKKHDELIICQITHKVILDGHYENEIVAIPSAAIYPPFENTDVYPFSEPQRAIVKDNKDPEKIGRIRVQFIWQELQKDDLMSPWIRIAQPHGGNNKGFYFIPEIEEEVMVGFENGNAEKPYVIGTLFHGKQRPEGKWYNGTDDVKAIRTRSGHTIEFYDTDGKEYIRIYDNEKENYVLTYSTFEKLIKLESKGNIELYADENIIMHAKKNIEMTADVDMIRHADENIKETAGKNITVEAGDDIAITAGKNMTESIGKNMDTSIGEKQTLSVGKDQMIDIGNNQDVTVGKTFSMEATDIKEEASSKMQLYSQSHEQKADSTMKIDGGSQMDIKAGNVKINS